MTSQIRRLIAGAGTAPRRSRRAAQPGEGRSALGVFVLLLALYLLTQGGELYSLGGEIMWQTSLALVNERSLALPPDPILAREGHDGRYYSKYGLGQPLLATIPIVLAMPLHRVFFRSMGLDALKHFLTEAQVNFTWIAR